MRQFLSPAIYVLPEYVRFEHAVNKAGLRDVAGAGLTRQILTIIGPWLPIKKGLSATAESPFLLGTTARGCLQAVLHATGVHQVISMQSLV